MEYKNKICIKQYVLYAIYLKYNKLGYQINIAFIMGSN